MSKLQELMDDISKWANEIFSDGEFDAYRTVRIVRHLKKEVPELIHALDRDSSGTIISKDADMCGEDYEAVKEEFADCFMLLLDAAVNYGFTANALIKETHKKLKINKKRQWGKPDENGVSEHTTYTEPDLTEVKFDPDIPARMEDIPKGIITNTNYDDINLLIGCPRCGNGVYLRHSYTINNKSEITITPSVGHPLCKAHFFVKDNKIKWVQDL